MKTDGMKGREQSERMEEVNDTRERISLDAQNGSVRASFAKELLQMFYSTSRENSVAIHMR